MTKRNWKDTAQTVARQAGQGLTFGFGDEIIDAPTALIVAAMTGQKFGDVWKEARGMTRRDIAKDWKEAPVTSLISNIAGSIPFALSAPAKALGNWARGNSMAGAVLKSGAVGAGYGAIGGAGSASGGEDDTLVQALLNRLGGAGIGAAIGAPLGAASGAAIRALSPPTANYTKVGKQVAKQQTSKAEQFIAQQLAERPDLKEQLARAEAMNTASKNTGIDLTLAEKLARSGSEPLLAQQAKIGQSPQTAGAMEALYAARSGTRDVSGQIDDALMRKVAELSPYAQSYDDVAQSLIKSGQSASGRITKKLVTEASPLYDEAYKAVIPPDSLILKNPVIQSALNNARGNPAYASSMEKAFQGGSVKLKDNSIQVLDAVKRQLDDMAENAARAGNRNEASLLTAAKNELLAVMDEAAPTYAKARAVYSGKPDILQMRERIGGLADVDPNQAQNVARNLFSGTQRNAEQAATALGPQGAKQAAAAQVLNVMDTARGDPTSYASKIAPNARISDMLRAYSGNTLDETLDVINQAKIGERFRYGSPTEPLQTANKAMEAAQVGAGVLTGGKATALKLKKVMDFFGRTPESDPRFYQDMLELMTTDKGMDLVRNAASGQATAVQKQLGGNTLMNVARGGSQLLPQGTQRGITQSAIGGTLGMMNQPQMSQPEVKQIMQDQSSVQGLPPGFVIRGQQQQQGLPPWFVIRGQ